MAGLQDLDLKGLGTFEKEFASFTVKKYFLEKDWDYILGDERLFWRVHQNGKCYVQTNPPGGIFWLWADKKEQNPPWAAFVVVDGKRESYFTNFWGPSYDSVFKEKEPRGFDCTYNPGSAQYRVTHANIRVDTTLGVVKSLTAACMKISVANRDTLPHRVTIIPYIKPYLISTQGQVWDMPWLYQSSTYCKKDNSVFFITRDTGGNPEKRKKLRFCLDQQFDTLCLNENIFCGNGPFASPAALSSWNTWRACRDYEVYGEWLFAAFGKELTLKPGQSFTFSMIIAGPETSVPAMKYALKHMDVELASTRKAKERELQTFSIKTPDEAFNRYANEFLTLQQQLVLRRGWPCNIMGTRDAAQDYAGAVAWYPRKARSMILTILEPERTDGWFLRGFSTDGRHGKHDERPYVDSGLWVWELVYEYVCQTRDFSVLREQLPFLDSDKKTPVLDHLKRLLGFYMNPENRGEHGLIKIYEGDWNDSANGAGLKGRGESVMASCHLVYVLGQAAKLFAYLKKHGKKLGVKDTGGLPSPQKLAAFAESLKKSIRRHALNKKGFLNGVFSDTGRWFFSAKDPDGAERINIPVNSFGMVAGIFSKAELKKLIAYLHSIWIEPGYPLFTPAITKPMAGLGRIGSTDLRAGLAENGACYNHGCHGFLARGLATAGDGDFCLDALRYLFPYDQARHSVSRAKTAPYSIVNVYLNAPDRVGMGGDTFFSGSIATAFRNVYQGILGVHAEPEGLRIAPCLPRAWNEVTGKIVYAGKRLEIKAKREQGGIAVRVNGKLLEDGFWASR